MRNRKSNYMRHIKNMLRNDKDRIREELKELIRKSKKEKDTRMFERYLTIKLAFRYMRAADIAKIIGRSTVTVNTYINNFLEKGFEGLSRIHAKGRPSYLTVEQKREIVDLIVNDTPQNVGFPAEMNWTSRLLREWIKREWDICYSDRGIRDLMYSLNLSFTRPTYTLAKADPEKQAEFKKSLKTWKIVC